MSGWPGKGKVAQNEARTPVILHLQISIHWHSPNSFENTLSVKNTMRAALVTALVRSARVTMGSFAFLGLALRITSSTSSTPKLCAGGPSMMMLIHSICMALRGLGSPNAVAMDSMVRAAKDVDSWNAKKFRMLKNIPFPSATARVIVVKSSSASTMSAASLATSVPSFPMATPMSAALSAVASFTPSPVMATMSPRDWRARTSASL
mmetsp:Transcript_4629/g.13006  ORF Transcript_4629/g.13006 Transcript_4629/m.13006 type:complete len:207 (-) Transcript_4629:2782-3402(-)